jgi:hypothetical protein
MFNSTSTDTPRIDDRELPYRFGSRPRPAVPFLFSPRQCSRLVSLRCGMQADLLACAAADRTLTDHRGQTDEDR